MKYILFCFLLFNLIQAADVNTKLFSENNVSSEIKKIRTLISVKVPADQEEQNKVSVQTLFLDKIAALSKTSQAGPIPLYQFSQNDKISHEEFLAYFNDLATKLNEMLKHKDYQKTLKSRLASINDSLKHLSPTQDDEILHNQLEYAYFKWKEILNESRIKQYQTFLEIEKKRYKSAFSKVDIDINDLEKKTNIHNAKLQVLYQKKLYLELRLEKEAIHIASKLEDANLNLNETDILNNKKEDWRYNFLQGEIEAIKKSISDEIEKINQILLLRQIHNLQNEDLENYIMVRDIMQSLSNKLIGADKELFILEQKMLEWLKYEHIGDLSAMYYDFEAWVEKLYAKLVEMINTPLFYSQDKPIDVSNIMMMFLIIIIGFMIAKFYKRRVIAAQNRFTFIQKQSFKVMGNIGYYIIIILTFAISLNSIGLDLSSLSLIAGALSVGIGFGLKEFVGNFVSGLILMAERSVKIGDFVELENGTSGNVIDIRMRSVTIKTSSNIDIVVPNSELVQHTFINYTLEDPVRRLDIHFTVAYGVSFERVNEEIIKALHESDLSYVNDSKEHNACVIMTGMDERGVNYKLLVFVRTYGPNAYSSFLRLIYKTLQDKGIPIPSPKVDVNMIES